jgi:hypothetical protein
MLDPGYWFLDAGFWKEQHFLNQKSLTCQPSEAGPCSEIVNRPFNS